MDKLDYKIIYEGYKGIALDGFSVKSLNILRNTLSKLPSNFNDLDSEYDALDEMSLDEIRDLTRKFCEDYLTINDVMMLDVGVAKDNMEYIADSNSGEEFYDRVNSLLKAFSPFDLPIIFLKEIPMNGVLHKQLIICPDCLDSANRKVYYEYIGLGSKFNLLSVPAYAHEIVHAETGQNIGYASDYLHREVVSIFLEKIVALKLDKSGKLLKMCERYRYRSLGVLYNKLLLPDAFFKEDERASDLMYAKSILIAEKLFDMYLNEKNESKRDKYIDDVNAIIEGKMTVEEMINKRHISIAQCQDYGLFLRHI